MRIRHDCRCPSCSPWSRSANCRRSAAAKPPLRARWRRGRSTARSVVATKNSSARPLPIERGLERAQIDRLRKLARPVEHGRWRIDDHVGRRSHRRRACRSSRAGPARGRRARNPRREIGRGPASCHGSFTVARASCDAHVRPLAGGRDVAQPIAQVLLRHEPGERQQRLGAQIARLRVQFQHARVVRRASSRRTPNPDRGVPR